VGCAGGEVVTALGDAGATGVPLGVATGTGGIRVVTPGVAGTFASDVAGIVATGLGGTPVVTVGSPVAGIVAAGLGEASAVTVGVGVACTPVVGTGEAPTVTFPPWLGIRVGTGEGDNKPPKLKPSCLLPSVQKRIEPMKPKATKIAINSSNPRADLRDDLGSFGGVFVILLTR
jgi:hypothetical protein